MTRYRLVSGTTKEVNFLCEFCSKGDGVELQEHNNSVFKLGL